MEGARDFLDGACVRIYVCMHVGGAGEAEWWGGGVV